MAAFAYLFASPLTQQGGDGQLVESIDTEVEKLDVELEAFRLRRMCEELHLGVQFRSGVATRRSLQRILAGAEGCEVVHFTGHGFPGGYLALEDGRGSLSRLDKDELTEVLAQGSHRTRLVFVSACFSEDTGMVFASAGVPHVVAVRKDKQIADKVSSDFAVAFYSRLFEGATVACAFDQAQRSVQLTPGKDRSWRERQMGKFLLLPRDADHDTALFARGAMHGEFADLSPPPVTNTCIDIGPVFLGRRVVMQEAVRLLVGSEGAAPARWVTLHGEAGVGKTSCAVAVCDFVCKRHACRGALFIPASAADPRRPAPLCERLLAAFRSHAPAGSGFAEVDSEEGLFEALARLSSAPAGDEDGCGNLFIVMDGYEPWAAHDQGAELSAFISRLLRGTSNTAVICTGEASLPHEAASEQDPALAQVRIRIGPLVGNYPAELLVRLSGRQLAEEEVMGPSASRGRDALSPKQVLRYLAKHPVLTACHGNPQRIGRVAEKLASRSLNDLVASHGQSSAGARASADSRSEARASVGSLPQPPSASSSGGSDASLASSASRLAAAAVTQDLSVGSRVASHQRIPALHEMLLPAFGAPGSPAPAPPPRFEPQLFAALVDALAAPNQAASRLWTTTALPFVEKAFASNLYEPRAQSRRLSPRDLERVLSVLARHVRPGGTKDQVRRQARAFWDWLAETVHMLAELRDLWEQEVIFGLVSKEAVNDKLQLCAPGTFLLRVSESCAGQLALALVQPGGRVTHSLLRPRFIGGGQTRVVVATQRGMVEYASVAAFVSGCEALTKLWPDTDKLAALSCVK